MMTLDFSDIIKKLKGIQTAFNKSESATQKYALLQSLNHMAQNDIMFKDDDWVMQTWRDSMLREQGVNVK